MIPVLNWLMRQTRRDRTGYPTTRTPEDHLTWLQEQIAAYAVPQPYASPLSNQADNWTGETWEIRDGYRRYALKEPSVKAALLTKVLAVCQLDIQVKPEDDSYPPDKKCAGWVKFAVSKMAGGGVPGLLWRMIFPSLVEGFGLVEKVQVTRDTEERLYPGFWTVGAGKGKDTRGIRLALDPYKNVTSIRSMTAGQGGMAFNPKDFLLFTHLPIFESPFGVSDLRAANRAANLIEAAIKLRAILLENFSGPYIKASAADPGTRSSLMVMLAQALARGWIVVPEGTELEVINLATSAPDQFQNTIEDLRQEIVTAIQGAYLQLLEGGIADGRGNTNVHKGVAELFQWWLATCAASCINENLVADLVRPNYGWKVGLPTVSFGGIDENVIKGALERFKMGQDMGVKLSKKQVNGVGGFESPEDESDILLPPQQPGGMPTDPNGPNGGGAFPDLGDVFNPGQPDDGSPPATPAPDADQGQDAGAVSFSDTGSILYNSVQTFSDQDYAELEFADRSHLVKKAIRDKNGNTVIRWVNPNSADHGDEQKRLAPREEPKAAVKDALTNPNSVTPDKHALLPAQLKAMTKKELQAHAKEIGAKLSGKKAEVADRILAHITGKLPPDGPKPTGEAGGKPSVHVDKDGKPSEHFKKTHPYATPEAIRDKKVTGQPNSSLADSTRPPVPDVDTARYMNNYSWGYDGPMNAALRETGVPPKGDFGGSANYKPPKKISPEAAAVANQKITAKWDEVENSVKSLAVEKQQELLEYYYGPGNIMNSTQISHIAMAIKNNQQPFGGKPNKNGPEMFNALRNQFSRATNFGPPPVEVKRGIDVPFQVRDQIAREAEKALASGGTIQLAGFQSTSTSRAFPGNIQYKIKAIHGLDMKPYSHFSTEDELLLNHNCHYKVTKVVRHGKDDVEIHLEQVSNGNL